MKKMPMFPSILLLLAAVLCFAPQATAQTAPLPIAVCDPLKVVQQIQEYKDMVAKVKDEQAAADQEINDRKAKAAQMQDELKLLLPDSPEYAEKSEALMKYAIEMDSWAKLHAMDEQRKQKMRERSLFDKVDATIAQIAHDHGILLVIAKREPELPKDQSDLDKVDMPTFNAALLDKSVLFTDPKLDITQDVVVAMDKAYAGSH